MTKPKVNEPKPDFSFENVNLSTPMAIAGGNHHMKYTIDGAPLYIQTPVCKVKHMDISGNKRPFCDLMFTNENEDWIRWVEELETHSCKILFERREKWFASELEMTEIENYFQSPLKIYKSGKFYVARTNISVRLGKMTLKIYDDMEQEVHPESVTDQNDVIAILQVHGIKCSARSFQVELELKQMMVLSPANDFEKCLLLGATREKKEQEELVGDVPPSTSSRVEPGSSLAEPSSLAEQGSSVEQGSSEEPSSSLAEPSSSVEQGSLADEEEENTDLLAVDIHLDETVEVESVELKPRNELHQKLYQDARKKAKEARAVALAAYLEAKHIKNTYHLDETSEDDDEEEVLDGK